VLLLLLLQQVVVDGAGTFFHLHHLFAAQQGRGNRQRCGAGGFVLLSGGLKLDFLNK
jgi:hypothetical protein